MNVRAALDLEPHNCATIQTTNASDESKFFLRVAFYYCSVLVMC